MNYKKIHQALKFLIIITLVIGLPVMLALNPKLYDDEVQKINTTNIKNSTAYYENVYDFLKWQKKLSFDFNEDETNHMRDVRRLMNTIRIISLATLIGLILYFIKLRGREKNDEIKHLIKTIKQSLTISIIILLAIISLTLINFNQTFNMFHKIFFPQGNWMFPANSLLIKLYPETFFSSIAKKIIIRTTITLLLLRLGLEFRERKNKKNNKKKKNIYNTKKIK